MNRRTFLTTAASTAASAALPLSMEDVDFSSAAIDETVSAYALDHRSVFGFDAPDDAIVSGREGYPESLVHYAEVDDRESIEDWADRSDERTILDTDEQLQVVRLRAPAGDLGVTRFAGLFGTGLATNSYVESISLNRTLSHPYDVTRQSEDEWDGLEIAGREWITARTRRLDAGDGTGLAFDDVVEITPANAREWYGIGDTSVDASDVTIAVIDSGVNHAGGQIFGSEYEQRILPESWDAIADETVAEEGFDAIEDGASHGSKVASQMLADTSDENRGIIPDADLLAVRALDSGGEGTTSDIVQAIRHAADEGADVLVLSLGTPIYTVEVDRALAYAVEQGAIPVAAVGNDRQGSRWPNTPASSEYAIGVGSVGVVETDDGQELRPAFYSNVGPHNGETDFSEGETADATPDVAGIGSGRSILRGTTGNSIRTETDVDGTSFAAPDVAAIVGLLVADGMTDLDEIRDRLQETAEPIERGGETEVGAGLVHAANALADDEPEDDQAAVRDDEAEARDRMHRTLSNSHRGLFGPFSG